MKLTKKEVYAIEVWLEGSQYGGSDECPFAEFEITGTPEDEAKFEKRYCIKRCGTMFPRTLTNQTGLWCPCFNYKKDTVVKYAKKAVKLGRI